MDNVKIGTKVIVSGGFGTEEPKEVTVVGLGEKNGKRVFDYQEDGSPYGRWAYFNQIVEVIE